MGLGHVNKLMLSSLTDYDCFESMLFVIIACPVRDTTLPISDSSSNVELFMACLWSHNHLTSIRFSSGDLVGRNTNCILGWYLARFSHTLFDLCIDKFQYQKYLFETVIIFLIN